MTRAHMRSLRYMVLLACMAVPLTAGGEQRQLIKFEQGDTLEVLRAKIRHNGYSFEVGHNWVYDMPREMKAEFLSRHPSRVRMAASDDQGPVEMHLADPLPAVFDWRNRDGKSYIGPVRDQGNCGSCYAFGACAAAEGTYNWSRGLSDGNCADFSESFIAWCLGSLAEYNSHFYGCTGADYDYQELQALVDQGVCNESAYPYSATEVQSCPVSGWAGTRVRFASWHKVGCGDIDAIKAAIYTYGVVDAAVDASDVFSGYMSGVYEDTSTGCDAAPCEYTDTNHAVALVGWDDNPPEGGGGCWILRNSWGPTWGENGYMRIRYTAARVACEVAYLEGPSEYAPPTPTPSSPVTVNIDRRTFSSYYGYMNLWVNAEPIDTPCFIFFRIATPRGVSLYLSSSKKIVGYPEPWFPQPVTLPSAVSDYYLMLLWWKNAPPGTYTVESGAVSAAQPVDAQGNINYLKGTYDRKAFYLQ